MKHGFVKTRNYQKFQEGLAAVDGRGAAESSLLLVTGEAGYGKSETVDQWAVLSGAAYLRAKTHWTPKVFLTELAGNLKVDSSGKSDQIFARVRMGVSAIYLRHCFCNVRHPSHCRSGNYHAAHASRWRMRVGTVLHRHRGRHGRGRLEYRARRRKLFINYL